MALCPFADKRWLIRPGGNDPRIVPRVAILHTDGGNAENLGPYFDGPSGGIESHFHIRKDGYLYQYRDTSWEADANYLANPFAVSIETQGTGYEDWTPEQIATILRLLRWLHEEHPAIALRKVTRWDGSGVGYHIQFGSPGKWTNVGKICPGPKRIEQYNNVILPALAGGEVEEEVALDERDLNQIARAVWNNEIGGGDNRAKAWLHLLYASNASRQVRDTLGTQFAALRGAVDSLPEGATKAEIRTMLESLDATIKIVVSDATLEE